MPKIAAAIARRLLAAGRVEEAWIAIEKVEEQRAGWLPYEWEEVRLDVLEALGRTEEAQAFRWSCFERSLSASHLRAFLDRLPDFDDVEAETKALDLVAARPSVHSALAFLINWNALHRAAVWCCGAQESSTANTTRSCTPAADAVAGSHPLAATLLLRAMIDFLLQTGRSSRYRHAARHFLECGSLAASVGSFGEIETHETDAARLRASMAGRPHSGAMFDTEGHDRCKAKTGAANAAPEVR